jgi:hypothetical protein
VMTSETERPEMVRSTLGRDDVGVRSSPGFSDRRIWRSSFDRFFQASTRCLTLDLVSSSFVAVRLSIDDMSMRKSGVSSAGGFADLED